MPVYILMASFMFLSSFSHKPRSLYRWSFALLFFLSAFRHISTGGYDAGAYYAFYYRVPDIFHLNGFYSQYQIGYTFLNALVKTLTHSDNYYWFQFFYTLFTFILLWLVLEELTISDNERLLLLFSYFCYKFMWYEWGTNRQNIADLFFWLYAIRLGKCDNGEYKKRVILLLKLITIPILFHSSALLNVALVPTMFALGRLSNKKKTIITVIGSIVLYSFGNQLIAPVLNYFIENVDERYAMYLGELQESNIINTILRMGFFLFFAYIFETIELREKEMIFNLTMIMVLIGSINVGAVGRIYEYYAIGLYTIMSVSLRAFQDKNGNRLIASLVYFAGFLIIMIRFVSMGTRYLYEFRLWF